MIPHLVKVESVNHVAEDPSRPRRELWAWAISAKRYMLFVPSKRGPRILETTDSEELEHAEAEEVVEHRLHGLGHLMNPTDPDSSDSQWTKRAWLWMLCHR